MPFRFCRLCFHTVIQNDIAASEVVIPHLTHVLDLSLVIVICDAL